MSRNTLPRLPGVPLLPVDATGPEYSRWRRNIKYALAIRDLWKYCNGECPMPMPEAGPDSVLPTISNTNSQPSLLEERRAWVKQDREVKLDIFMSLTEETMQEVFDVGLPPPLNLSAQDMMQTLDERFAVFKFEAYHHAFCHFLHLHVDQFASIEEFNREFSATLEDLVDYGQPLSNTQACSAYLSKLRCIQNPWVAKKLEEWDSQHKDTGIMDLIKESPPWSIIRPLATKNSQTFQINPIPEEQVKNRNRSDSDAASECCSASTISSASIKSPRNSNEVGQVIPSQDLNLESDMSPVTSHSQEIVIRALSEDIAEIDPQAFYENPAKSAGLIIPARISSKPSMKSSQTKPLPPTNPSTTPPQPSQKTWTKTHTPNTSVTTATSSLQAPTPISITSSHTSYTPTSKTPTPSKQIHPAHRTSSPSKTLSTSSSISSSDLSPFLPIQSPTQDPPADLPSPTHTSPLGSPAISAFPAPPTFTLPRPKTSPGKSGKEALDLMTRLSGDSPFESSEVVRERERKGRVMGMSMGMGTMKGKAGWGFGRFGGGGKVRREGENVI